MTMTMGMTIGTNIRKNKNRLLCLRNLWVNGFNANQQPRALAHRSRLHCVACSTLSPLTYKQTWFDGVQRDSNGINQIASVVLSL